MRKDIKGYEGIYEIEGNRVFSLKCGKVMEMTPQTLVSGYQQIGLTKNGVRTFYYLHRLVAEAFVPNPDNKPEINHINGDKSDNRPENLQWATKSENIKHSYDRGLRKVLKGENHGRAVLKDSQILEMFRLEEEGMSKKDIAKYMGCSLPYTYRILNRKVRKVLN